MSTNTFLEKFKHKTNAELEHIIADKKTYVEDARMASIQILKERNGETQELENAEKEIVTATKKNIEEQKQKSEEQEKKSYLTDNPNAPELHSKKVIMVFSAIFSTIFGAVLLMYNMRAIGNHKARIQVLLFGIIYTIASIVLINELNMRGNIAIILNIAGAGILNEYFWNKFIGKEFQYRKRSWIKPAIISVIIMIPFILAMIYGGELN